MMRPDERIVTCKKLVTLIIRNGQLKLQPLVFFNLDIACWFGFQAACDAIFSHSQGIGLSIARCEKSVTTWMGAFERQLLVMIEAVGKQGMVGGHRHLQRLDHTLEMLDTMQHFLHTGRITIESA